jgi:hypothetical protein
MDPDYLDSWIENLDERMRRLERAYFLQRKINNPGTPFDEVGFAKRELDSIHKEMGEG